MRAQRIDQLGPLADEQITGPVLHQPGLALGVFTGTLRTDAHVTASQTAAASAASFLVRFT